jgi:hypothetical protein
VDLPAFADSLAVGQRHVHIDFPPS